MIIKYISLLPLLVFYVLGYFHLIYREDAIHWLYWPLVLMCGVLILKLLPRIDMNPRFIKNYELMFLFALEAIVILCLLNMDLDRFRLSREVLRVRTFWEKSLLVHLFLSWSASMILNGQIISRNRLTRRILFITSWLFIAQSLLIAYFEGRRTAAILPIVFLGIFRLSRFKVSLKLGIYSAGFLGLFATLFGIITSARTGDSFALQLLLDRLFWPAIALNDILTQKPHFDPQTLTQIVSRAFASVGYGEYISTTNDFGRYMGYLHNRNFVVGINYGIIGEGYLMGGVLGVILSHLVILVTLAVSVRMARNAPFRTALLLPFLFFHGYQMEIPYTLIALLKGGMILGGLSLILGHLSPKPITGATIHNPPPPDAIQPATNQTI